ncbi:eCIS core domain-containing protein [Sorangium sp. So ce1182]|uniref:eCIS core domain-containing protein n=1 Tax=Sorangium sp. So ce1182 TaxID=3133334 RepID=UPI003F621F76
MPDGTVASPQPQPAADAPPAAAATFALLVEDGETPAPGQLRKSAFLAALEASLTPSLGEVLADTGFSATNCPVLVYWLSHYRGRSAADVERALKLYTGVGQAPSAHAYVSIAVARVVAGAVAWRASGDVNLPAEAAAAPGPERDSAAEPVMALRGEPAPAKNGDPKAIQRSLGAGQPLPASVRQGMEAGFGADFSSVRLHTDAPAGRLAADLSAHAFAVGDHVAFAPGVYAPGTLVGDLVLAHELAHTLQQSGRAGALRGHAPDAAEESGLERSADLAAARAVLRMREGRGESIPEEALRAHEAALAEVRSEGPAHQGLRLQRCDKKSTPTPTPTPWWEQVPEEQKETKRDLFFRPVTDAHRLRDLLRQVDMIVAFDPSKEVLKKPPGKKLSDKFVPGSVAATQWTSPEVKKEIDAILPPGSGTIVTKEHIDSVKKVVDRYRKLHPGSFSMLQGVEAVNCAATGACIGTMNKLVEKLYGPSSIQTIDMDDTAFGTINKLKKENRIAQEKTFAATYIGDADNFVISKPPVEVTLSGAGRWVLDTANKGSPGVHVFIMSLVAGYHSVSLAVLNDGGGGATTTVWKDHHGSEALDANGLDASIRRFCWGYYAFWLKKQYNEDYDPDVHESTDIPKDKLPEIRKKIKPTILKDIKQTRIAHLNPNPK